MNKKIFKMLAVSMVVGGFAFGFNLADKKDSADTSNLVCEKTFAFDNPPAVASDNVAPDARVEAALQFAIAMAKDNTHGYSQGADNATANNPYTGSREGALPADKRNSVWTPDFDCSSLIYWSLENGGFKIIEQWQKNNPEFLSRYNGEQYTGDADTVWMDLEVLGGWKKFSWNEIKNNLQRGDILCIPEQHIAFYIGNGKTVEARGVNNPKVKGHYETGDQGGEIDIYNAQGRGWTEVYRYVGK